MTDYKRRTVAAVIAASMLVSAARAGKPCDPGSAAACPEYTAPATTAVPGPPIDGSTQVPNDQVTVLFGGVTPPNGFMIQQLPSGGICAVNANGPPAVALSNPPVTTAAFQLVGSGNALSLSLIFVTPPGYKPMGPVSILCTSANAPGALIEARAW
jgi:hypothetical protein